MSVMDMNSRMAMAEKLSIPQLQQAIQSGSIPAYIGIPLIEQKTKERAQMAAAQGGQPRPPSVVSQILQQAEQEDQGITQLPSNLPMMDDEEMGMAGGGIIAFAEGDIVEEANNALGRGDLEQINPMLARTNVPSGTRFLADAERLRDDPSYRAFVEQGGVDGDARYSTFIEMGNASTPQQRVNQGVRETIPNPPDAFRNEPSYEPVSTTPAGRYISNLATDIKGSLNTYDLREKLYKQYSPAALGMSNATDTERAAAKEMLTRIRDMSGPELRALAEQGRPTAVSAVETTTSPTAVPARAVTDEIDYSINAQEGTGRGSEGIAAAPGAKLAPPGTPGAPRTAPAGTPSAASRTAPQGGVSPNISRQISSVNPGAPASLSDAENEASKSPRAAAALSMLDKYVAMLEKSGEDVGRQKKEALYMALIQGGLGMMGGTSPNAFENISKGLLPATQAYQQAIAGIRKDDRARIEKLINAGLSKEKLAMELKKLGIEEKKVDAMVNYYNARAATAGSGGGNEIRIANAIRGLDTQLANNLSKVDTKIRNLNTANPMVASLANKSDDQIPKNLRGDVAAYRRKLNEFENEKNKWVNLHSSRVQSLGGVTLGEIESASGGGNMPKGIPQGSRQVGTSGGKPVYEAPDGKRYIVE